MMVSDSLYSLLQPYLWLNNVLTIKQNIDLDYDITVQIFYITNTAFALILLHAIRFFQRLNQNKRPKNATLDSPSAALLRLRESAEEVWKERVN
jgi:hypothetical protein